MKLGHLELPTDVCTSLADVMTHVQDKWASMIIVTLSDGTLRFGELRRSLGPVSQKVLTATLRGLERDGFVRRMVTPTIPPRVDYTLTDLGRELLVPLGVLTEWALSHRDRITGARALYDATPRPATVDEAALPAGP